MVNCHISYESHGAEENRVDWEVGERVLNDGVSCLEIKRTHVGFAFVAVL